MLEQKSVPSMEDIVIANGALMSAKELGEKCLKYMQMYSTSLDIQIKLIAMMTNLSEEIGEEDTMTGKEVKRRIQTGMGAAIEQLWVIAKEARESDND